MPNSCLDVALTGGAAWVECLDQVTSKGPSNLSHSATLEKQLDAALSHCPPPLWGQGETRGHLKGSGDGQCSLGHSCFLQEGLEEGSSNSLKFHIAILSLLLELFWKTGIQGEKKGFFQNTHQNWAKL